MRRTPIGPPLDGEVGTAGGQQCVTSERRCDQIIEPRRDREPPLCEADRWLPRPRPRQPPELTVRHTEHRDDPRDTDRATGAHRYREGERLTGGVQEHAGSRALRGDLAAIEGDNVAAAGIVVHEKSAAAEPRGLRLDKPKHRLHRDRCIDGRSARTQHLEPGFHSPRIGSGHHAAGAPIARRFRLDHRCADDRLARHRYRPSVTRDGGRATRDQCCADRQRERDAHTTDLAPHSSASMSFSMLSGESVGA